MHPADLIPFVEEFYAKNVAMMKRKNADYSGASDNGFANFMALSSIADKPEWVEVGFLTRMQDKFMRIIAYVKRGHLEVADEGVIDTLQDVANYAALMAAYLHWKQQNRLDSVLKPKDGIHTL